MKNLHVIEISSVEVFYGVNSLFFMGGILMIIST